MDEMPFTDQNGENEAEGENETDDGENAEENEADDGENAEENGDGEKDDGVCELVLEIYLVF